MNEAGRIVRGFLLINRSSRSPVSLVNWLLNIYTVKTLLKLETINNLFFGMVYWIKHKL